MASQRNRVSGLRRRAGGHGLFRALFAVFILVLAGAAGRPARAQISFATAVDLALKNSPRVKMAEANVNKARAALEQTRDVYVPNLAGGSSVGYSYGFPVGQPSVYNFTTQALILNFSQRNYVRAARAALDAANLALRDVRLSVAEDAAVTYLALDHDQQRVSALREQAGYAARLVDIVGQRLDAGQSTEIELTTARLSRARIHLAQMSAEDDRVSSQTHLENLTGLAEGGLRTIPESIPNMAKPAENAPLELDANLAAQQSPAIGSAYANAISKQQIALGDARYNLRPQIYFAAQYNRYAEFNNYPDYYQHFQHNNAGVGVEITVPFFDAARRAQARESAAEATRARYEADSLRGQFVEAQQRARRATEELRAKVEVADLDQKLAEQQLAAMTVQLQAGTGDAAVPPPTPLDEQNSRIAEREKYLALIEARFQFQQAEISLMRQTGDLESWLKSLTAKEQ